MLSDHAEQILGPTTSQMWDALIYSDYFDCDSWREWFIAQY